MMNDDAIGRFPLGLTQRDQQLQATSESNAPKQLSARLVRVVDDRVMAKLESLQFHDPAVCARDDSRVSIQLLRWDFWKL
ncbi:MAG: hypothetical protein U0941_14135 [Planctomycetaceae bacterium]